MPHSKIKKEKEGKSPDYFYTEEPKNKNNRKKVIPNLHDRPIKIERDQNRKSTNFSEFNIKPKYSKNTKIESNLKKKKWKGKS